MAYLEKYQGKNDLVNHADGRFGQTVIFEAAKLMNFIAANRIIQILYNYSKSFCVLLILIECDINKQDGNQQTALYYLADKGNAQGVELMKEYKANVGIEDYIKQTPLFYAAKQGNVKIAKALIEIGCSAKHIDLYR